jgi:gas vesicle protein
MEMDTKSREQPTERTRMSEPYNYKKPEWDKVNKVHDWKNYISKKLADMWDTFTDEQKLAIAENAEEIANNEEWD